MIELGAKVRDKLTGFEGTVIARVEYLTGHIDYDVQPSCWEGNKMPDSAWISQERLEIIEA